MSACNGHCDDCPYTFCTPPAPKAPRPSKAQERRGWRQDALFELEDLADIWGVELSQVRL
ncbi:hypothetical protein [Streptomyces graminilatus]|uniref:hypothetical protein n=1 Tax=Streptomyces graminilatus TaxID=1464070 RepID=UPI0006E1A462|nr:hypothetical protein [Streptomyces graminilatus]